MSSVGSAAESVFREESGRVIASLIRVSGCFDRAEEAMQEAFAAALAVWPGDGIPANPGAWIMAAAHRKLIDSGAESGGAGRIDAAHVRWIEHARNR